MITEARIDNLLRCVRNNEEALGFDFPDIVHPCGAYGCLMGNDALASFNIRATDWDEAHEEFGRISGYEYIWDWTEEQYGIRDNSRLCEWLFYWSNNRGDTREQRVARLRKFIYYVLHKRELLYDDSGAVRETARRTEGDHHVLRAVKSAVERKEREQLTAV